MKQIFTFLLVLSQYFCFSQQTKDVELNGTLLNDKNEILNNVSVTLWENTDSILSVLSDAQGKFAIKTKFNYDKTYMLTFDYKYQTETDIIIYLPSDSIIGSNYTLDVQLVKNITANAEENAAIFFGKNKTSETQGFDINYLKLLFEQSPTLCLDLYYMGSSIEKKDHTKARIKFLKKYLEQNNIPMHLIRITDDKVKVRAYEIDQRSAFWISVISKNGCN
ncbi:MAG: hypothetical protein HRT57_02655 [Crocinitomicaceae bacterium]|nr:hypothetical protein [Crocinitomicaceae bacterium]